MGTLKQKQQQQQIKGNKGVFLIKFIAIISSGRLKYLNQVYCYYILRKIVVY